MTDNNNMTTAQLEEYLTTLVQNNVKFMEAYYKLSYLYESLINLLVLKEVITDEELIQEVRKLTSEILEKEKNRLGIDDEGIDNVEKSVILSKAFGAGKMSDA